MISILKKSLFFAVFPVFFSSCSSMIGRAIVWNDPTINDLKAMPHRVVKASEKYLIPHAVSYNTKSLPDSLTTYLKKTKTVAFLVIKHDSLLYEWYEKGYSDSSYTNPFSATKSVVGILTGVALKEGKIKSLDEPVANYIPSYKEGDRNKVTFKHLLTMTSGLDYYDNALNPVGHLAHLYYGRDVRKFINTLNAEKPAGTDWRYKNADTEILSIAVANAVGMKLSDYASQKLWQPIGAERDAKWIIDDQKDAAVEKAYCCLYTNAHDLAKVGMLYEHHGNVRGSQIVDSSYMQAAIQPVNIPNAEKGGKPQNHYGYSWWTENVDNDFHMDGMRGQYVIVLPKDDMIVVRLGKKDWYKLSKRFKPETPNFYGLIVRKVRDTFGN